MQGGNLQTLGFTCLPAWVLVVAAEVATASGSAPRPARALDAAGAEHVIRDAGRGAYPTEDAAWQRLRRRTTVSIAPQRLNNVEWPEIPRVEPPRVQSSATPPATDTNPVEIDGAEIHPKPADAGQGAFGVQVATFDTATRAAALVSILRDHGHPAYHVQSITDPQRRYRVLVGVLRSSEDANTLQQTLRQDGHAGHVVTLGPRTTRLGAAALAPITDTALANATPAAKDSP